MTLDGLVARLKRVRKSGRGHVALCPAHDDRKRSLSVGQGEGLILMRDFAGCSLESICGALGIHVRDLFDPTMRVASNGWSDAERKEYARRIWQQSRKAIGTVVERYLRNRGIRAEIPPAIRFVTRAHESYPRNMLWPALAAGIQDAAGNFTGISITWLCADGSDKAPVEPQRKIYGPYSGGAVRLDNLPTTRLAIGEGVETMLSVMQATGLPCWAALSASNLPHVQLPEPVREVIICADRDAGGEQAAERLAQRMVGEGREVRIARPHGANDFNEMRL